MNLKDILAALNDATDNEREAFRKALDNPASEGGLTREQLDAALEPFAKGAGGPADFGGSQAAAQLDVTGWIQQITNDVMASVNRNTETLDAFAKSLQTLGRAVIQQGQELEELRKSMTAPGASAAVTRESQVRSGGFAKSGFTPAPGGVVQPPTGGDGRFAELTEADVVAHLQRALAAEEDPMRKSRIGEALTQVELDYAITDDFFDRLGIASPA